MAISTLHKINPQLSQTTVPACFQHHHQIYIIFDTASLVTLVRAKSLNTDHTQKELENNMRLYQPLLTLTAAGLAKINQQAMEVPIFGSIGRLAEIKDKNKNDEIALERHNLYRKRHVDTPSLVFDPLLCDAAQASANSIAAQRSLIHNFDDLKAHSHGENLGMQWSEPNPPPVNYSATIDAWYLDEIGLYDYTNPGFSIPTSHFTQVVWKLTTSFCMRHAFSDDGLQLYYAARYVERGNRLKLFSKNVMPLKTVEDQEHFDQIFVDGISELAKQDTTAGPGGSGDDTTSTTIPVTTSTFPTVTTTACPCGFESLGLATGGCVLTGAGEPCDGTSTSALATSTSTLPTTTSNTSQTLTSPVVTSTTLPVTSTASTTSATQTTSASVNASSTGTSTTMPIALSTTPTVPTTAAGTSTSAATSTAQTTTNSTQVTTTTSQITTTTTQATNTTTQAITMTTQASSTTSTQATTTLKTTSTTKASTTTQSTTQASTTIKRTTPSGDISSIISALPASKQVAGQDLAQEKVLSFFQKHVSYMI